MRSGMDVICETCGRKFHCWPSRLKAERNTCSHACAKPFRVAKKESRCVVCEKNFHVKACHRSHLKGEPTCSRECRGELLKTAYSGENNPNFRYLDPLDKFFARKISNIKKSATTRGLSFDLEWEDLRKLYDRQKGLCFYSDVPMGLGSTKWASRNQADPDVLSVDRVDPERGYLKDNVVLCCTGINKLKGNATAEETDYFLRAIALKYSNKIEGLKSA